MVQKKRLNLGCGRDIRAGWINLDSAKLSGVDVVHDVEKLPLPFKDSEFDEILCQDLFEHVDYIPILKDLHRILKKGGKVIIRVPHFTSRNNYIDPTHKKRFSVRTFEFFVKDNKSRDYYFDFQFEGLLHASIRFQKGVLIYNHLIEPFVNISPKVKNLYEATCLSRLFPAENIVAVLIK